MTYRINGFKQIEAFYSIVFSGKYDITPQHISLYMFLLNQNNRANWVEWFKCPYDLAMNGAMIGSKKTYYKCLNELKDWNLIDYIAGENQFKAPKISLLRLENAPQLIPQCEPASEPLPIPPCEPLPTTARVRYINYITNNFNKLITNNLKQLKEIDFDFDNFFVVSIKSDVPKKDGGDEYEILINVPFEDFWDLYDKKVGSKEVIERKWGKLTDTERIKIMDYIPHYRNAQPDKQYRKNPETFLNGKGWNDEIINSKKIANGHTKKERPILTAALEVLRNASGNKPE